jgi:tetratricopeptide (TPR) repeat protein
MTTGRSRLPQWLTAVLSSGLLPPVLALAVWSPVLTHGLLWDDPVILERQLPGLTVAKIFAPPPGLYQWTYHYYRPVTLLSLFFDHALYGKDPFGYHLTVWLLHAAAAWAVYALARRMTSPSAAVLGASLFAVFPASAECVGWIAGRNDILAGLFSALAAAVFLAAAGFGRPEREARASMPLLAGASGLFLLALLSKESAIGLAPVLAAAAWAAGLRGRDLIGAGIAAAAPVALMLAMRAVLDPHAAGESFAPGPLSPLSAVFWTAAFFPVHLVAPFGSVYRLAPPTGVVLAVAGALLAVAAIALAVKAGPKRRPDVFLALVWVFAAIGAASAAAAWNVTRTPVADRYFYLPAIGWCVLLGALAAGRAEPVAAATAAKRARTGREGKGRAGGKGEAASASAGEGDGAVGGRRPGARLALGWALVLLFSIACVARRPVYADDRSFWTAATAAEPDSGAALMNLGNVLAREGDLEGAQRTYRAALDRKLGAADLSLVLTDLGSVLYQSGKMAEAEGILRRSVTIDGAGATANFNLGAFLFQKAMERLKAGDVPGSRPPLEEARPYLEKAVAQDASHVRALTLLGHCYESEGRIPEARAAYERVIAIEGRDGYIGREAADALDQLR